MAAGPASDPQGPVGDEEDYHFFYNPFRKAIVVNETDTPTNALKLFLTQPLYAPLLFPNTSSDARDHAANERTYLAYLRLSVYLAIVSVAIFINFHLKHQPTPLEMNISHPLGIIFWLLALACLGAGFANYVKTVAKYARKAALVQSGLKTQVVFGVVSCAIIAACGVFLAAEAQRTSMRNQAVTAHSHVPVAPVVHATTHMHSHLSVQDRILSLLAEVGGNGASAAAAVGTPQ